MKVAFTTFGCKVNLAEMEQIASQLPKYGAERVPVEDADILIVNTCAVTETAQREGEKYLKRIKAKNPHIKIIATGCVAELKGEGLAADVVVANADKGKILDIIGRADPAPTATCVTTFNTRAFLKIQDGCNSFCTYCIIPSLRGAPVSVPLDEVINDVKRLIADGYKEIVLTGIHVGLYKPSLTHLLRELIAIEGEFRLRLTSLYVDDITVDLIDLIAHSTGRICPHVHISLQSGSAKVLRDMGRRYTPEDFSRVVGLIRDRIPLVNIGADLIVGFPNESDDDFADTMRLLEDTELDYLHIFPYSKRPGTPAATMGGQVAEEVKRKRAKIAQELAVRYQADADRRMKGQTLRVLSENGGKGHADNYYEVTLPEGTAANEFIEVII